MEMLKIIGLLIVYGTVLSLIVGFGSFLFIWAYIGILDGVAEYAKNKYK